jgi:putative membrane protein|tara:strand:+ start:198 stop:578 length:381 start_codon:yes stop_codon:yes gene_type:complete
MAGLLYLPRIFVYHAEYNLETKTSEIFKIMEKKLFFYIMTPAMVLSWLFGLLLIQSIGFEQLGQTWMILKIIFVLILTFYHFYLGNILNQFKFNNNIHSHKFYRYINEIPTILLILIVFVVIFKPI